MEKHERAAVDCYRRSARQGNVEGMTNLGFYWADNSAAPTEPDWDNLDWSVLTQAAGE